MALLGLALLSRGFVPAGWMPTGEQAFAVTICTGMDMQTVWMDRDGGVHKSDPSKKNHDGGSAQDCAFAGFGTVAVAADADYAVRLGSFAEVEPAQSSALTTIGQGLAAPPPPSTGPPVLI